VVGVAALCVCVQDLEIIHSELRLKDIERLEGEGHEPQHDAAWHSAAELWSSAEQHAQLLCRLGNLVPARNLGACLISRVNPGGAVSAHGRTHVIWAHARKARRAFVASTCAARHLQRYTF
jgi:hypothetical protein